MKRKLKPILPAWLISGILLATATVFCMRSRWRTDVFAFFPPSAHLQAVASERGGVLVFLSEVPFDPQYGWSVDAGSVPAEDFAGVHQAIIEDASRPRRFAGFAFVRDQLNPAPYGPSFPSMYAYAAVLLPWWSVFATFGLLPVFPLLSALKDKRRKRRGLCVGCGYDLRGSPFRCPECGRQFSQSGSADATNEGCARLGALIRPDWVSRILVVLIVAATVILARTYLSRWRATSDQRLDHRAGLDRRVRDVVFEGVPLDQAMDILASQTGTKLVRSTTMQVSQDGYHPAVNGVGGWKSPIYAHFLDVSLTQALGVLAGQARFRYPLSFESRADGTIFLGTEDEMVQYFQVYDTRGLYRALSPKLDTSWPEYPGIPRTHNSVKLRAKPNSTDSPGMMTTFFRAAFASTDAWFFSGHAGGTRSSGRSSRNFRLLVNPGRRVPTCGFTQRRKSTSGPKAPFSRSTDEARPRWPLARGSARASHNHLATRRFPR